MGGKAGVAEVNKFGLLVRDEGGDAMDAGTLVKFEPCAKRVRVFLGGKIIVD